MSQIYRVFIRHESDAQPAYIKVQSEQTAEAFLREIEEAMKLPAPSIWRCVDFEDHTWVFRADKIYTACIYPPEEASSHVLSEGTSVEVEAVATPPETDPGTRPVAEVLTYDDLDAVENTVDSSKE